ncbi:aldehyde dehydrogenase family protein [Paraburkholderia sp. D1E]|uniref:aldehyde dehydrogenase family protein n=1 Tax=Paraburkholderia sp. D1E TaxID=3461398 RepID=UPI0040459567
MTEKNSGLDIVRQQEQLGASFIDGAYVPGEVDPTFKKVHPGTGEELFVTRFSRKVDVANALQAARRISDTQAWQRVPPYEKREILLALAAKIDENAELLGVLDAGEMGKTISDATFDAHVSAYLFRYYAESLDKWFAKSMVSESSVLAYNKYAPRGVIGAIAPWNYPTCNAALKIAPVLCASNSVVLKPSEHAYLSTLLIAKLASEAGLPNGVLNVVTGTGEHIGDLIARSAACDMITFTGSHQTGRKIMRAAAESNGKPILMECGGKNASIVMPDMDDDLSSLAERIAAETYANQGQLCVASSRVLVHKDLAARLTEELCAASSRRIPSNPFDPASSFGTIVNRSQRDRMIAQINQAKGEGNRCLLEPSQEVLSRSGSYLNPVVFDQVQPRDFIAQTEIFGPVLAITTFDSIEQAIEIANCTEYGLSASVWTRDFRAIQKVSNELVVGKLKIRASLEPARGVGFSLGSEPARASGFGVETGLEALESYSRLMSLEITG